MSNVVTGVTEATAPEEPAATQTPTVTHYQLVAANLNKAIDDMLALMPNLVESHPATKGAVRSQKTVSNAFIISAIAAVEQNPEIDGLHRFDVTEARDVLQFSEAFRPMRDKLYAATLNVGFSIDFRRANIVEPALEVYALTKGLARNPEQTSAAAHAANLKRDLGRSGRRKKKVTPAPAAGNQAEQEGLGQ
ncbi:MAG TPA: hypothetical protein VN380_21475 [Thermoanaerobaculia bacterium]|jgi:hypothetical protein|nr:hypothetical protein [Thermoanaerobaculia bacterium]